MNTWRPQATCHPPNPFFYDKKIDLLKRKKNVFLKTSFQILFSILQFLNNFQNSNFNIKV